MKREGLISLARHLVPSRWRAVIASDVEDEAQMLGRGSAWHAAQLACVGVRMHVSLAVDLVKGDLHHAARSLLHARWFTLGAVLTFMLGIGVNVAVFSAVDRLLFRPLPYDRPDGLVLLRSCNLMTGSCVGSFPSAVSLSLLQQSQTIADIAVAGFSSGFAATPDGATQDRLSLINVSPRALRVLGVRPRIGRDISDEEIGTKVPVAWISEQTWRARFAGASDVVGRTLWAAARPVTIIGVLPADFIPPTWSQSSPEWAGLVVDHDGSQWTGIEPSGRSMAPFARLRRGISIAQAQAELDAVAPAVRAATPPSDSPVEVLRVDGLNRELFSRVRGYAWLVVTAAWLVLMMACTNLASLFLARGRSRDHVAAIARTLGASSARLMTISIGEGLIVCAAGAVLALGTLALVQQGLLRILPPMFSRYAAGLTDARVLGFSLVVTCVTALVAGVVPSLRLARIDPLPLLQHRGMAGPRRRVWGTRTLLATQATIGAMLAFGAVLAARSFSLLAQDDLGVRPQELYVVSVGEGSTRPPAQRRSPIPQLLQGVARLRSVESAAEGDWMPIGGPAPRRGFEAAGTRGALVEVSKAYFKVLGTPVIAGRPFEEDEIANPAGAAIVNRSAAGILWPDLTTNDVVGRTWQPREGPPRVIVGVTADAKGTYGAEALPAVFVPIVAQPSPRNRLFIRVRPGERLRAEDLQAVVRTDVGDLRMEVRAVSDMLEPALRDPRFRAVLLGVLAVTGLLLAAVGLFAIASYDAAARRYELGVRVALGASPGSLKRLVVREACLPVVVGVGLGLGAASWITTLLQPFLFRIDARHPLYYLVVVGVLVATAGLAAWVPARRAARLDPVAALKVQ